MSENGKGVYESAAGTAGVGVGVTGCLEGDCEGSNERCQSDGGGAELVEGRCTAEETLVDGTNGVGGCIIAGAGSR